MASTPHYRCTDAAIIRATTYPFPLALPPWPELLANPTASGWGEWVQQTWPLPGVREAIEVAGPDLARTLTVLCEDDSRHTPLQIRRAAQALLRYMLRWSTRATPFGRFAGIAPHSPRRAHVRAVGP